MEPPDNANEREEPKPCPCNLCCYKKKCMSRTSWKHIRDWGEFGRTGTVGEFLQSPVKPADNLVYEIFRFELLQVEVI